MSGRADFYAGSFRQREAHRVIMGNNLHSTHRPLKFLIQARWDLFALSLTAEGRRARDFLRKSIKFMKVIICAVT